MKQILILMATVLLSGCTAWTTSGCENEVRKKYEGKCLWVKNVATFRNLVLLDDSTMILVVSNGMTGDYITSIDTIFKVKR